MIDNNFTANLSKFCSSSVGMGKSISANMLLSHCINNQTIADKPIIDWKDTEYSVDNSDRFNELFDPNYLLKIIYDQSKRLEPKFQEVLDNNILNLF